MEYLSEEKLRELEKELEMLRTVKRKEIAESLEFAKSLGDLSENSEYIQAREDQANVEERIAKLESVLKSAVVVSKHHSSIVEVGSTVVVEKSGGANGPQKYQIVGSEEADMSVGKISNTSPLGAALFGRKKGETVSFKSPKGPSSYVIVDIE
ncbi:transcription elongation factor GreA [Candidatus Parcubacteria bacterium]|nr:transcription elongation factor GreA [Candidatus Parcubacteria bacterium]